MRKIGLFSGTFDPVHAGHLAFARLAIEKHGLENIIFLPERQPRHKTFVSGFSHRQKMLKLATAEDRQFEVFDTREKFFKLKSTLPKLEKKFRDAHFVIMLGSDSGRYLGSWDGIDQLKPSTTFLIGIRSGDSEMSLRNELSQTTIKPKVDYLHSPQPDASASSVRTGQTRSGIDKVDNYIAKQHLYS